MATHVTQKMKPSEFAAVVLPMALNLDEHNWDQSVAVYRPDEPGPCCFGTHLARLCGAERKDKLGGHFCFIDGMFWARAVLHCSEMQLDVILHFCGAAAFPFLSDPWPSHPQVVMERLLLIESLPPHDTCRDAKNVRAWKELQKMGQSL